MELWREVRAGVGGELGNKRSKGNKLNYKFLQRFNRQIVKNHLSFKLLLWAETIKQSPKLNTATDGYFPRMLSQRAWASSRRCSRNH